MNESKGGSDKDHRLGQGSCLFQHGQEPIPADRPGVPYLRGTGVNAPGSALSKSLNHVNQRRGGGLEWRRGQAYDGWHPLLKPSFLQNVLTKPFGKGGFINRKGGRIEKVSTPNSIRCAAGREES